MAITKEHPLHKRRLSRNIGLGVVLVAFSGMVFGLTIAKVSVLDPARLQAAEIADQAQSEAIDAPKAAPQTEAPQ